MEPSQRSWGGVVVPYIPLPCILRVLSGHKDRIARSSTLPYGEALLLPSGLSRRPVPFHVDSNVAASPWPS